MHTRSRLPGILTAAGCLLGVAAMSWAAFLPFVGWWGDSLNTAVNAPDQNAQRLALGPDAWFVFGTLLVLATFATCHAAGSRRHVTAIVCLGAAVATLALALKLPGTYELDGVTYGQPIVLDAGFYLFLGGAAVAVIAALVMMVATFGLRVRTTNLASTSAGGAPS